MVINNKGNFRKIGMFLLVSLFLVGVLILAETPEEESARLEQELADLESQLSQIDNGTWVNLLYDINGFINPKKEKSGFHSLAIAPKQDLLFPQAIYINHNLFKYISVIIDKETWLGWQSLANAPDLRSGAFHRHVGSNFLSNEMNFSPPASKFANKIMDFFNLFPSVYALTPEEREQLESELSDLEAQLALIDGGKWANFSCNVTQILYNNYNLDNYTGYHTFIDDNGYIVPHEWSKIKLRNLR